MDQILTLHFEPGSNLGQLDVPVVRFLVRVMSGIKRRFDLVQTKRQRRGFSYASTRHTSFTQGRPDLKEMKSSWLAKVITRLLSSFGTGNKYLRMLDTCVSASGQDRVVHPWASAAGPEVLTLCPSWEVKL